MVCVPLRLAVVVWVAAVALTVAAAWVWWDELSRPLAADDPEREKLRRFAYSARNGR